MPDLVILNDIPFLKHIKTREKYDLCGINILQLCARRVGNT
jgi:hypothetical protein